MKKPEKIKKVEHLKPGNPVAKVRQFKQYKPKVIQSRKPQAKAMPDADEW